MNTTRRIVLIYLIVTILLVTLICMQVRRDYNSLVNGNFSNLLNTSSKLALKLIDSEYSGPWNIVGEKLYKGNHLIDENFFMIYEIKEIVDGEVTIFKEDTRIATTVTVDGKRQVGTKASPEVIEEVIKKGDEYSGKAEVLGMEYATKYVPLIDSKGQVVGMFFVGVPQGYIAKLIDNSIYNIIKGSIVLIVIATIFYNILIRMRIVKPLEMIKEYFELMASGDFTKEISYEYLNKKDEFGQISISLKNMQNSLKQIIFNIRERSNELGVDSVKLAATSEEMSAFAQELASTMQQIADGATSQAQDLTEITDSLIELTNNIEIIHRELQNVKTEMGKAEDKASIGKKEVDILVKSIEQIRKTFKLSIDKIGALTDSIKEISGITEIISDISEQTNLLALNAAIEAARAGEHGRGFAVVADEVRKLAEESKKSTERIADLVSSIIEDSHEVTYASQNARQAVKEQTKSVESAVKSFGDILASVENITALMNKTYSAIDKSVKSKDAIVKRVEQLSAVTEENSAATEELAASSEELTASSQDVATTAQNLNVLAEDLMEVISKFKV